MQSKIKICTLCDKPAEKLWKSNPAIGMCCVRKYAALRAIEKASGEHKHGGLVATEDGKVAKVFYQTKNHKRAKSLTVQQINKKAELNEFFDNQALQVPERCENCNRRLNAFSKWAKRFVTAHILPKALFPSVATHPDNRMFLGVSLFSECSCHSDYDNSDAERRKTMPCYSIALSRAEKFYDELTGHEQNKFDKYFGINIHINA